MKASRRDISLAQGDALLDLPLGYEVAHEAGNADAFLDGSGPEAFREVLRELEGDLHRGLGPHAGASGGNGFLLGEMLMGRHGVLT